MPLNEKSYIALLGSKKAQMVFVDPPYNVPIVGNVSGLGKNKHREFAMASGEIEMSQSQFIGFLKVICHRLYTLAPTLQFTSSAWIGDTCAKCWKQAKPDIRTEKSLCLDQNQRWDGVSL